MVSRAASMSIHSPCPELRKCASSGPEGIDSPRVTTTTHTMLDSSSSTVKSSNVAAPSGLFAVFDGHGGKHAAAECREQLLQNIAAKPSVGGASRASAKDVRESLVEAFVQTDRNIGKLGLNDTCGTTATSVLFQDGRMYVAWVGDTRAVLGTQDGSSIVMSHDHRATREDEVARIENLGGFVLMNRVDGILSVSRALGDHNLKKYVVAEPEVVDRHLQPQDDFVIVASDGLWDFVSDDEAVRHVLLRKRVDPQASLERLCQSLSDLAVERGSTDDITCMIVMVDRYRVAPQAAARSSGRYLAKPALAPQIFKRVSGRFEAITPHDSTPSMKSRSSSGKLARMRSADQAGTHPLGSLMGGEDFEFPSFSSLSSLGGNDARSGFAPMMDLGFKVGSVSRR